MGPHVEATALDLSIITLSWLFKLVSYSLLLFIFVYMESVEA